MRSLLLGSLALLAVAPAAHGLDIFICGQSVPPNEVAVLRVDLTCTNSQYGVYLGKLATLVMDGHRIVAGSSTPVGGVGCDGSCTITGPGEISGLTYGVSTNGGTVLASDLFVHDCEYGITATQIRATNVTANNNAEWGFGAEYMNGTGVTANENGEYGFYGPRLVLSNATMSRNGDYGVSAFKSFKGTDVIVEDNVGAGVVSGRVKGLRITAGGNQGGGVFGNSVVLRDSTLLGNVAADVGGTRRPRLTRTSCGKSVVWKAPGAPSWGVCAQD